MARLYHKDTLKSKKLIYCRFAESHLYQRFYRCIVIILHFYYNYITNL